MAGLLLGATKALFKALNEKTVITNGKVETPEVSIVLEPKNNNGFILSLENKTSKKISIDWNKTFYLRQGATDGFLDKRGVDYILPEKTGSWTLFPVANQKYQKVRKALREDGITTYDLTQLPLTEGEHGIYLSLNINGENKNTTPVLRISKTKRI